MYVRQICSLTNDSISLHTMDVMIYQLLPKFFAPFVWIEVSHASTQSVGRTPSSRNSLDNYNEIESAIFFKNIVCHPSGSHVFPGFRSFFRTNSFVISKVFRRYLINLGRLYGCRKLSFCGYATMIKNFQTMFSNP